MKNATAYSKKLATLQKKLKQSYQPVDPDPLPPLARLVMAFLEWNADTHSAHDAYGRLMEACVDLNDLRVTHSHEVARLLGPKYPLAEERAERMRDAMHAIFKQFYATSLEPLGSRGKKQVRSFLDSLPGMVPYVAAQVTLMGYGGHAVPVDEVLVELLKGEQAIDPEATLPEVVAFLERHVRAEQALETHLLLRGWADAQGEASRVEQARASI